MLPSLMLALALSQPAAATELHAHVQQCEQHWLAGDYDAAIAACDTRLAEDPDDIEALWRKARSLYGKGEVMANAGAPAAQRLAMYEEVVRLSERILAIDADHGAGLHWKATGLGRSGTTKGVLSSLFLADDIEDAWLAAARSPYKYRAANNKSSLPGDVYFGLGQFYRLVPDWALVKLLTGTKGDIDESIRWLRKLAADSPGRAEVAKELGVSLLCKAERDGDAQAAAEGRQWLDKALAMPAASPTDRLDRQQIPVILSRADEACGYSRDGWQDVSKEAYDKRK